MTIRVIVQASLDDLRSDDMRFLQQASMLGPMELRIPSDDLMRELIGVAPKFPQPERRFLARSLRWVSRANIVDRPLVDDLDSIAAGGVAIALRDDERDPRLMAAAEAAGIACHVVSAAERAGFPLPDPGLTLPDAPRVIVTGSFDWLHSGHVRFFMDAAEFGPLFVVVGSDKNVELLKGPGHPLQGEAERRYMVGSLSVVHECLISTGSGWMDAEPEIGRIRPTSYVVNEDGDQLEKREFCETQGIDYIVLKRVPQTGLPVRSSTELRGF